MSSERQGIIDARHFVTIDNTKANIDVSSVLPLAESNGTLKFSMYGKIGSTLTAISLAVGGGQDMVMHGEDSGGNVDPLRTNASQQLQVEVVPLERPLQLDPVLIPSSEGILLDGSASLTSGGVYEVTFEIVNIDGVNTTTVDIGVDIAAVGSLAAAEYMLKTYFIGPGSSQSGNKDQVIRTITIAADDDIRGIAANANRAAIHFVKVKRVS